MYTNESETMMVDPLSFIDEEKEYGSSSSELTVSSKKFSTKKIGSIAKYIEPVKGSDTIDSLVSMFQKNPDLQAIPVEEDDRVIGVIDRKTVFSETNTIWKRFSAKTISEYIQHISIILYVDDFIEKALPKVYSINKEYGIVYFPVFYKKNFFGIVSLHEFLSRLSEIREQDLQKASIIQTSFFPDKQMLKSLPYTVTAWNRMANMLGGDVYQAFKFSNTKSVICCFDVSGKNVAASLLTISVASFFKSLNFMNDIFKNPKDIVSLLDGYLETIVPPGNFITGVICFFNSENNMLYIFNCGHASIFMLYKIPSCKKSDVPKVISVPPGLPPFGMGVVKSALDEIKNIKERPYTVLKSRAGLHVDLYTDGLSDMQNDDGVRFEDDNVEKFFVKLYEKKSDEISKLITQTVDSYVGHSMIPDDITVIDIRF